MKSGIKQLVQFMNGPFISDDQNFLKPLFPYFRKVGKTYEDMVTLVDKLQCHECDGQDESEDAGTELVIGETMVSDTGGSKVHETLNHKCYPLNGSVMSAGDPNDKEKDELDNVRKAISAYQIEERKRLYNIASRMRFLMLLKSMANDSYIEVGDTIPLVNFFVNVADYIQKFAGSVCMLEMRHTINPNRKTPVKVLTVSAYLDIKQNDRNTWRSWVECLKTTNITLEMRVMGPGESAILYPMEESATNWCFSINHDNMSGADTFILTDCKPIVAKNTYGLTIMNKDFTLNVASNIEMRVPNGVTFRFIASADGSVLDTMSIRVKESSGYKTYEASLLDVETLRKCGIIIENSELTVERSTYVISVTQSRDIQISLNSMMLTFNPIFVPTYDPTSGFSIISESRGVALSYGIRGKIVNPADIALSASFCIDFKFITLKGLNVAAYVLPIRDYAGGINENATKLEIATFAPVRTNTGYRLMITTRGIPISAIEDGTVLLRVVFGNGSLTTMSMDNNDAVKFGNYEVALQLELSLTETNAAVGCSHDVKVVSAFGGYTFGTTGTISWNPPMPMPLYTAGISMVSSEYYHLTTINPCSRTGEIKLLPNVDLEDVPLGIPVGTGVESCEIEYAPIDDNNYFAFIKIPYTSIKSSANISMPTPSTKNVHQITVQSMTRQLFNLHSEQCFYDEVRRTAIYNHPILTCDKKYLMLPVFFKNIDCMVITIEDTYCSDKIKFTIDVNLGELPTEDKVPDDNQTGDGTDSGTGDSNESVTEPETPPVDEGDGDTSSSDGETDKNPDPESTETE